MNIILHISGQGEPIFYDMENVTGRQSRFHPLVPEPTTVPFTSRSLHKSD